MKSFCTALPLFGLVLAGLLASAGSGLAADFATEAKTWSDEHAERFEQAAKLTVEGYAPAGNQMLVDLADEDGGPLAAYLVANTLFGSDPAASYRLHERALQALPDEPAVALEMAMEQHRRREYAAAIVNYRRLLAARPGSPYAALLADCLVRTGQLQAAVQAWGQAGYDLHPTAIDAAIFEIYGPLKPGQRRGELIAKIEGGDLTKLTDLILLDLNFDTDWWNTTVFDEGLDYDLKRAFQFLDKKDARYQQLTLYARLARPAEKKPAEIERALKNAKLVIGTDAALPADSQLARALCELAVGTKVATAAELWTAHSVDLHARLPAQDRDALRLLCWFAAANHNPELTDLNRLGWEEWNDPAFAPGYLIDLYREKKLTSPNDSQLMAAMAVARDDAKLNRLRIELAGDNVTNEMVVGAIKAEYHKLSLGERRRDSSTLNGLFYELGKRL